MKFLIILALTVAAFALPQGELVHRNRVMPVQDSIEGRITSGQTAAVGQFPYQVGLSLRITNTTFYWCGGSLISNQFVLTAAHCTDGIMSVIVVMGATDRFSPEATRSASGSDIIIHPNWNADTVQNDISMIRIAAVAYSNRIQPVKLPAVASSYPSYVGQTAVVSGWGYTSDNATGVSNTLQFVHLLIQNNTICEDTFGSEYATNSTMCVNTDGGKSPCSGDSGGPLVLDSSKEQIGLDSYGAQEGCQQNFPEVFTRITSFRSWIRDISNI